MRINRYLSLATGLSRRRVDELVKAGQVSVDGQSVEIGQQVSEDQGVSLNGRLLHIPERLTTLILNKPVGYVVSRNGQGSKTIYDLLPNIYAELKPIGRLDKDSSGLLLLTNDGQLAQSLAHPANKKLKVYTVRLNKPLQTIDQQQITDKGVRLEDGISRLGLKALDNQSKYQVQMFEGRNRQIRRTFSQLGYGVVELHRSQFGQYSLGKLKPGEYKVI